MKQSLRGFVDKIDFYTSFGHGEGGDHRKRLGITTQGPMLLVTDLAVWEPDPIRKEFTVTSLHPGVTRDAVQATVGWTVAFADSVTETPPPTTEELDVLRALHARTDAAHGKKEKAA